jgi:hypothetical protein
MGSMSPIRITIVCVYVIGLVSLGPVQAGEPALPSTPQLLEEFIALDNAFNDGKGYSEAPSSASLGWGESIYLQIYWNLYVLTGETR